jgi:hypothetical protein
MRRDQETEMKRLIIATLVGLAFSGPVFGAEKTIGDLIKLHDKDAIQKTILEMVIGGIGEGFSWANADNESSPDFPDGLLN